MSHHHDGVIRAPGGHLCWITIVDVGPDWAGQIYWLQKQFPREAAMLAFSAAPLHTQPLPETVWKCDLREYQENSTPLLMPLLVSFMVVTKAQSPVRRTRKGRDAVAYLCLEDSPTTITIMSRHLA